MEKITSLKQSMNYSKENAHARKRFHLLLKKKFKNQPSLVFSLESYTEV